MELPAAEDAVYARCAAWARAESVDPGGTAPSFKGLLALEWPPPWPRDAADDLELAGVAREAAARGIRLQLIMAPSAPIRADGVEGRLICHRRTAADAGGTAGPSEEPRDAGVSPRETTFTGFVRSERSVPAGDLIAAALDLLDGDGNTPAPAMSGDTAHQGIVDLLVCVHGSRDRCCGSAGTALVNDLLRAGPLPENVRLWRTSHLGGHRFAANAVLLPEGTVWGRLDVGGVRHLFNRKGPVGDLLPRYRGCAGLPLAPVQALERVVLGVVGWPLLEWPRSGEDLGGGRFRLSAQSPTGPCSWEAQVTRGRLLPIPECGRPPAEATNFEPEWLVDGLSVATL